MSRSCRTCKHWQGRERPSYHNDLGTCAFPLPEWLLDLAREGSVELREDYSPAETKGSGGTSCPTWEPTT